MAIPGLAEYDPIGVNLDPTDLVSLPVMAWMYTETATLVPAESVTWLLAQGWEIDGPIDYDTSTSPPTPRYNLTREAMHNDAVLQSLVNVYTSAYNEGRILNAARYNNIVGNWGLLITATGEDMVSMASAMNNFSVEHLARLDTDLADVEGLLGDYRTSLTTDMSELSDELVTFRAKLDELETNYDVVATAIGTILTSESTALTSFVSDHDTQISDLQALADAYAATIEAIIAKELAALAALETDFDSHKITATNLLLDLGVTEEARINEQFDNRKSAAATELVDRGLYSSGVIASINSGIERERSEALVALADRLAREKWENAHRVWEQATAVHGTKQDVFRAEASQQDGIIARMTQEITTLMGGIQASHGAEQQIYQTLASQRDRLLAQQQDAARGVIDGGGRANQMQLANADFNFSTLGRFLAEEVRARFNTLQAKQQQSVVEKDLYQYQIDTMNNLVTGLYGFQERRTDSYPSMEVFAQLTSQLGDASSTSWVQP